MKASIDDVARLAGVSTATVSRTFSRPEVVSDKTRTRVLDAADRLNFSVSRKAGILKSGRSYRIALLIGSGKIEWFTARLIEGLNEVLRDAGYDLVIYPIGDADARRTFFDELPVRGNADAVIVSSFAIDGNEIERLNTVNVPIIGINITSPDFAASTVIDDTVGIRLVVRHLAQLGHRRLLYMYEDFTTTLGFSSRNRISGFAAACDEIPGIDGDVVAVDPGDDMLDALLSELYSRDDPPTAVCFHQDSIVIPIMFNLRRRGIRIPEDLSITGYDNSTFSGHVGLTTVRQKPYDMAVAAARKTIDLIEGRPLAEPHELFPVQLLVRDSTTAPAQH